MTNQILKKVLSKVEPYFVFKILSSIFTQMSSLFLIYLLPPSEFGYLTLIISVAQVMFTLTSGWSNGAVINLGTKRFAETGTYKDIVYYRGVLVLVCFVVISILFLISKRFIIGMVKLDENIMYVYILYLGYMFYDFSYQLLYPGNKNNLQSVIEFVYTLSLLIITLTFVKTIQNYTFVFLLLSFLFLLATITCYVIYFGNDKFKWNSYQFKNVLKYSSWQLLSVIGIYLVNLGNNYVFVLNRIPVESIGLYNFAFRLFSGFTVVFGLFGILIPKWIHAKEVNNKILVRRIYLIIFCLSLGYLLLALVIKPFIVIIGKTDYLESAQIFYCLFPAFIFMCYVNLMNTVVANTKFYKLAQYAILLQVVSIFIFGIPLVRFYGINGAIIAASLSYMICAMFFYILFMKNVKRSLEVDQSW